ncbi:hypothetical protein [Streptomyces sp. NBC_01408]|uniref:hypothetical protein n=1 Tax=Streptomyces sp. NBC_01408 TaxID=2903855 RepID=UPI002255BB61|nr:hypothetical protein [Streptomyces sp. NBC_01408]MCX4696963.1 hypothetical protein [Streptomyces sp. NBC_01408]
MGLSPVDRGQRLGPLPGPIVTQLLEEVFRSGPDPEAMRLRREVEPRTLVDSGRITP